MIKFDDVNDLPRKLNCSHLTGFCGRKAGCQSRLIQHAEGEQSYRFWGGGKASVLCKGLEAYAPIKLMRKEDGTIADIDETLTMKVIEFDRDSKRLTVSHSATTTRKRVSNYFLLLTKAIRSD